MAEESKSTLKAGAKTSQLLHVLIHIVSTAAP